MNMKKMKLIMQIKRQISGGENPRRLAFFMPKTVSVYPLDDKI